MEGADWIKDALIVLAAAGLVVPLFLRLGIGSVLAFLVVGVVVGPHALGRLATDYPWLSYLTVSSAERVAPAGELGVLFLLFIIGLELSVERLWKLRRFVLGAGALQVGLAGLAIAVVMNLLGFRPGPSAVIGLGLALSSTAIVMQILIDEKKLALPAGQLTFGVLLFQDLMVVPILILIGILSGDEPGSPWLVVLRSLGLAVVAVGIILMAGRLVLRPLFTQVARSASREAMLAIALLTAVGTAVLTHAAGLSGALGAFLAGLVLGETAYRHQIESDIEPFKGLFLGLFFMTVGMAIDPQVVLGNWALICGGLLLLLILKGVLFVPAALLGGIGRPAGVEAGFLLAGAGEFAFVVFTLAGREGVMEARFVPVFLTLAALSMTLTPLFSRLGAAVARRMEERGNKASFGPRADEAVAPSVVIGGFGRVGRLVARVLESEDIPYAALDLDADRVKAERALGRPLFYGDASRPELLARIGASKAAVFVVTPDAAPVAERMVREIRKACPGAKIVARARDTLHARTLMDLGASEVIPETLEAGLLLAGEALGGVGFPDEVVEKRTREARALLMARFARKDS
ncbi:MAG: cation:proton antiporter [Hyphomicrobiaceae bacterium]|nr:cation:proton antiporter [Hyphomicrobiaceae bacterium]